jgi:hypothetical protein
MLWLAVSLASFFKLVMVLETAITNAPGVAEKIFVSSKPMPFEAPVISISIFFILGLTKIVYIS